MIPALAQELANATEEKDKFLLSNAQRTKKVREELSKVEAGLKKTKGSLHGNPPRFEEYLADGSSSSSPHRPPIPK